MILVVAVSLALALPAGVAGAAKAVDAGQIKLDPQYHAPGCEPIPSIPTVGRWFAKAVLAYDALAAASADCGQVGGSADSPGAKRVAFASRRREGTANGWTYILWSEQTDAADLLSRVAKKLNLTRLVLKRPGESFSVKATGHAFFLVQLDGDEAKPALVWTASHVKSLVGTLAMAAPEGVRLSVESVTHEGRRCSSEAVVEKDRSDGPTELLPCR
jgi:hypothetical protein